MSLPRGGGAIRGIGEKFAVNPATGTGTFTVPLATSPGRSGFGPELSLGYDSGNGNGSFGFGWRLAVPAITRKTDKGIPRYVDDEESDVFILSGAEDLVPVLGPDGKRVSMPRTVHSVRYRVYPYLPRVEGLFARIERWVEVATGIGHWRVITRDNVTTLYGFDDKARIADPEDPRRIFSYLICRTFDDRGNVSVYDYVAENSAAIDRSRAHETNRTDASRSAQHYLKRIRYGNGEPYLPTWGERDTQVALPSTFRFEVVLDYGDHADELSTPAPDRTWPVRPDPFSSYRAGFEVRTYRRCRRVLNFHHFETEAAVGKDCLVRSIDFTYSDQVSPVDPQNPVYTFLQSVTQTGYRRSSGGYVKRALPALELEYSEPRIQRDVLALDAESLIGLPEGLDGSRYQWVDLDGEGVSGILADQAGGWSYKRNWSPVSETVSPDGSRVRRARFGPPQPVAVLPSQSELGGDQQLLDLSGGGRLDAVAFSGPLSGFFERTATRGWAPFQTFASLPRIDWGEPNQRFVDLTGDGRADVLITEDDVFRFYPSLGRSGFGPAELVRIPADEERGPRLVLSDGTETIFLADMSGDGLGDLVRVRNGEVCYWPNLGYGRFGAKVTMDGAPRFTDDERFDPRRVRLADVDGSGTADLLYLGDDGVQLAFNRSGNTWAEPHRIAVFPAADRESPVQVLDLLGTGTACLVWSSPWPGERAAALRYVDLMGGQKPHLLVRSRNNLGAETRIRYAPSTRFYLADELAGQPWITRLPQVVHVVERVETYDFVGRGRLVTRYAYHHGHFDGVEREFRGFGMVEQWDTEEHRADTAFPADEAWDAASWSPPALTRTWFHTGAFVEAAAVSRQYAAEYWTEPALRSAGRAADSAAMQLPDSVLPTGLTASELREAYRALKGMPLHIEVYAEDGSPRAGHPYSVTEQSFTVLRRQARGDNRHAVFFVHPREKLTLDYERCPDDPRVTHELTFEVNAFGDPTRSASVGYPRREGYMAPEPALSADYQAMLAHDQTRLHVAATERRYTNAVSDPAMWPDARCGEQPAETLVAELTGIAPAPRGTGVTHRFTFGELDALWRAAWTGAGDIPYEDVPATDVDGQGALPSTLTRRIVERTRTLYRSDDLSALLPLGTLEPRALPGETYRLALTATLVARLFDARVPDAALTEGGYVQAFEAGDWWIPSGRVYYSSVDGDSAARELAQALAHFFLPRRAVDAFGGISRVAYDVYDLLPVTVEDAVGNTTAAGNDYRVLQPAVVTDPNGNRAAVAFDALGLVVGRAVMGKTTERLGDTLEAFEPDLDDSVLLAHLAAPRTDPGAILGGATSRIVYDLFAYSRTRGAPEPAPVAVYSITRETHVSDLAAGETPRFRHALTYSDGFGREIQRKAQAEPGPVVAGGPDVTLRWIGSGWLIYDNKGRPVRQYEPFFSASHRFEFARMVGVSSVLFYDPVGRKVATLFPDSTWEKIVFDPWRQETWDRNDTVSISDPRSDLDVGDHFRRLLGSAPGFVSWHDARIGGTFGATADERAAHKDAAGKTEAHAATPSVIHLDALGRACLGVADNAGARYSTRTALDTAGKPLAIFDALGRRALEYCLREPAPAGGFRYVAGYDFTGKPLYASGMDGGARRTLGNAAGNPIRLWDARDHAFRIRYDLAQRPTHRHVRTGGAAEILFERSIYGEGMVAQNLAGRLFRRYDPAGLAASTGYDFKGNLVASVRQLAAGYRETVDWSAIAALTDPTALDAATTSLLVAGDAFSAGMVCDALDRPIQVVTPHRPGLRPSVMRPAYGESSRLVQIDVWLQQATAPTALLDPSTADAHAVTAITYDARGQRASLTLGNGSVTAYTYDPQTFRLARLATTRLAGFAADQRVVQDLAYAYDPVGNVTRIRDSADTASVIFFDNRRVEPSTDYTYDAIYRLTAATGREHLGLTGTDLMPPQQIDHDDAFRAGLHHPGDGNAVGTYTETYAYDPVGNLTAMIHQVSSGSWSRRYAYAESSAITTSETGNRLSATSLPGDAAAGPYSARYAHDAHGNLIAMPHLPRLTWDEQDRLQSTTRQVVTSGTPETTYYASDATGQRVRKATERQAAMGKTPTRRAERIYLGAVEIYRTYDTDGITVTLERETLHVEAGAGRVAVIETRTFGTDPAPRQLVRYQYGNHLGSAALELDDTAAIVSYEEYFPFGSTSYQAVRSATETPKRYRYTGKERDEENDLSYHGARYYAPWLGRWTSPDPAGMVDGTNLYAYVRSNPVRLIDPSGRRGITVSRTARVPSSVVPPQDSSVPVPGSASSAGGGRADSSNTPPPKRSSSTIQLTANDVSRILIRDLQRSGHGDLARYIKAEDGHVKFTDPSQDRDYKKEVPAFFRYLVKLSDSDAGAIIDTGELLYRNKAPSALRLSNKSTTDIVPDEGFHGQAIRTKELNDRQEKLFGGRLTAPEVTDGPSLAVVVTRNNGRPENLEGISNTIVHELVLHIARALESEPASHVSTRVNGRLVPDRSQEEAEAKTATSVNKIVLPLYVIEHQIDEYFPDRSRSSR